MTNNPIARYEFGPFVLDRTRRVLERCGEPVEIAPKALDLLIALVERPGRVLTKREIMDRVWPGTFVEDGNIAQNISLARKALRDAPGDSQMIITVPRLGYQFAAPVRAVPAGGAEGTSGTSRTTGRTLIVFPFTCVAGEDVDRSLGSLFADALAESLAQIQTLFVQAAPAGARQDSPQTRYADRARAVGADAFLVGYYQRRGTWWHVAVQLFRTHDETMAWSKSVRSEFSTVTDVRDAVSNEVLTALIMLVNDMHPAAPSFMEPVDREAFRQYIRGRHFWNKRTSEGLQEAFDCAIRAIETDPTYARGHLGIADTYNLMGGQHAVLAPQQAFPRARTAAFRALEIDESCGEAYASLGFVSCWYDWDYIEAERHFRRAMELKPIYATAYHWWGEALACLGRFGESLAHFETAVALDPLSSAVRTDFAAALSLAGEYSKCEQMVQDVLKFDPDFARGLEVLAINRERMRDYVAAGEYAVRALQRDPSSPSLLGLKARAQAGVHLRDEALATLRQIESLEPRQNLVRAELASAYAALNQFNRAEELLVNAFQRREPHVAWMLTDSRFDRLRAETDLTLHWVSRGVPSANGMTEDVSGNNGSRL